MVPEDFRIVQIEECLTDSKAMAYGILQPGSEVDDGVPMIRTVDIGADGLSGTRIIKVSKELHHEYRRTALKGGEVILSVMGTVGRTMVVPKSCSGWNVNRALAVMRLNDKVDAFYFSEYLKSPFINDRLVEQAIGSAQKRINLGDLRKYELNLPPLAEQRKIASILVTWDKAISTTEHLISNSKQQKKALMQQLLTGKKRLLDDSGKPFEGELQRLSMSDLATIDKESLGKKTPDNFEFNYISLSDVETGRISRRLEKHVFDSSPSRARRIVRKGDILLATVRPNLKGFAKVEESHDGMIASTGFSVLSPKKNVSGSYLYHYLFSCHLTGQIDALVVGSNYPAINSSDVGGLKIYCPSYSEQQKIASVLNNADEIIKTLEQQLADLKQEKKALMQQLLTGKRRVKFETQDCIA